MKKVSLLSTFMLCISSFFGAIHADAQATLAANYYFTAKTGTYTALSGGTGISSIQTDDAISSSIPIGFTFTYCGTDYTNIYASSNGWITFGSTPYTYAYPGELGYLETGSSTGIGAAVMPLWDDLSGSSGTATYSTSGTAPDRIFTIEFKDWLWDFSTTTPALSYQVKLFEGTNVIQITYKQEAGTPAWDYSPGATIGISGGTSTDFLSLSSSGTAPTASSGTLTVDITTKPATNQIYQFAPYPSCFGTPVALVPTGPATRVCPGVDFTLAENTATVILEKAYQWQSRPAGVGVFTDIAGATAKKLVTNITANTDFQLVVSCPASGLSKTSPIKTINVLDPMPLTASGPTSFCDNQPFALSGLADTGVKYQWVAVSTGDIAGATTKDYTPVISGKYTLRTTTPACLSGVTSKDTINVTVKKAPVSGVSPSPSVTFCIGSSATLNGSGTGNYQWVNAASGPVGGATATTYNTSVAGDYYLVITDPVNACADTSGTVAVISSPAPTVSVSPAGTTNICTGLSQTLTAATTGTGLSYQWLNSAGVLSGATEDTLNTFDAEDYRLVVYAGTCTDTSNVASIRLLPLPPANITSTGTTLVVCPQGSDMVLEANSGMGYTYQWYYEDAAISGASALRHTVNNPGLYKVRVTDIYSCYSFSDTFRAINNPAARPSVSPDEVAFCQGSDIRLFAGIDPYTVSYQWLKNDVLQPGDTLSTLDVATNGSYKVEIKDSFHCVTTSDAVSVTVYELPAKPVITQSGMLLSTSVYPSYQWYRDAKPITGAVSRTYLANFAGKYSVEVSNARDCYNTSDKVLVDPSGTGIGNQSTADDILLYPNPVAAVLYIKAAQAVRVQVKDLQGKVVYTAEQVSEINMQDWAAGLYFVTLSTTDGTLLKTEKISRAEH